MTMSYRSDPPAPFECLLRLVLTAGVLIGVPRVAAAHDFWLVPIAFHVAPGDTLRVLGQTGMAFPSSVAAVDPARVADARILDAERQVVLDDLTIRDSSLVLRHVPRAAGQRIIALRTKWRHVPESAESFMRYLDLEGAGTLRERYLHEGLLPSDSLVRRYAKYAKALIEVGSGPRAFDAIAGHPLEFVHLDDPSAAGRGDRLRLRLLFRNAPLAEAIVYAGAAPARDGENESHTQLVTNARGEVSIPITREAIWNVRSLHIVPSDAGEDADWDVHWVSAVFSVLAKTIK